MTAPAGGWRTRLLRRPLALTVGVVLGLGAVGGLSGAALGGVGALASAEHDHGHHGEHGPMGPQAAQGSDGLPDDGRDPGPAGNAPVAPADR